MLLLVLIRCFSLMGLVSLYVRVQRYVSDYTSGCINHKGVRPYQSHCLDTVSLLLLM